MNTIEEQRESLRNSLKEQFELLTVAIDGLEAGLPIAVDFALDILKIRRAQITTVLLELEVPLKLGSPLA